MFIFGWTTTMRKLLLLQLSLNIYLKYSIATGNRKVQAYSVQGKLSCFPNFFGGGTSTYPNEIPIFQNLKNTVTSTARSWKED